MNFIFFNPDEMRADGLACYGHPVARTPNFDRLAAEGVLFEQCHVQHPVCAPSRCSTMTGLYPHVSGHRTLWHLLRPHEPNLLRYVKEGGWHVRIHGKNDLLATESAKLWCDYAGSTGGKGPGPNPFKPDEAGFYSFLYSPMEATADEVADARRLRTALEFLRSSPPEPFFLFITLSWPHPPYSAPHDYHEMYDPGDLPLLRPAGLAGKPSFHELIRKYRRLDEAPDELFRKVQAVYLGMVSFVDMLLGELMATLDETDLADRTALFAFSDHGDWAGDYGLVEKWPSALDDTITRIPLVARLPGGAEGHAVAEPVELMDLTPTVMELAGLELAHTQFGRSLAAQLHGAPGDPKRAVYAEGGYDPHEPYCFEGKRVEPISRSAEHIYYPKGLQQQEVPLSVCRAAMIRTLDYKLIRRGFDTGELYDLRKDPQELHNVYDQPGYASVRGELESRMLDWYLHTSDVVPREADPRGWT